MTAKDQLIQDLKYEITLLRGKLRMAEDMNKLKDETIAAIRERVKYEKDFDTWLAKSAEDIRKMEANRG
jgi:hypothetical protein